jgi:hypothetical protein
LASRERLHRVAIVLAATLLGSLGCGGGSSGGHASDAGIGSALDSTASGDATSGDGDATYPGDAGDDGDAAAASDAGEASAHDAGDATVHDGGDASVHDAGDASTANDAGDASTANDAGDASTGPCACSAGQICVGGVCQAPLRSGCSCAGWQVCTASGACVAPPEQSNFRVGACYHSETAVQPRSFLPSYHQPGVRSTVQAQLRAMAAGGSSIVKHILWMGDQPSTPQLPDLAIAFPPTAQQLQNLHDFAVDVSTTLRPDGTPMDMILGASWLSLSDPTIGDPAQDKVGWGCMSVATYSPVVIQTYQAVLGAVQDVFRPDGLPVVSLVYFWTEVFGCATDDDSDPDCLVFKQSPASNKQVCGVNQADNRFMHNEQWFINQFYPAFVTATYQAGMIPSVYFLGGSTPEWWLLDNAYVDPYAAQVPAFAQTNGHAWGANSFFRAMWWMKSHNLPLPARLDIDPFAPPPGPPSFATPGTSVTRYLDDIEALAPYFYPGQPLRYAITEQEYSANPTQNYEIGKAWAAERLLRGNNPEFVTFWPDNGVGPAQFDFASFSTAGIVFPFASLNPGFATSSDGVLPDGWHTLVPSSAPANASWTTTGVPHGVGDLRFDSSRCSTGCAYVESDRVPASPGQTVVFHLWQENGYAPPAGTEPPDGGYTGMTFTLVPSAAGVDGPPLLEFGAANNATTSNPPLVPGWNRYTGVFPLPEGGVDSVRLQIGMQGTPTGTVMDVEQVQ